MHTFFIILSLFLCSVAEAQFMLEDVLSQREWKETGIESLTPRQQAALEDWLNSRFIPREFCSPAPAVQVYLSLNIENGSKLEFSNGTTYDIAPEDRIFTIYWITPFPVSFSSSDDPVYTVRITNIQTGKSVNGRIISTRAMIEAEKKRYLPPSTSPPESGLIIPMERVPTLPLPAEPESELPPASKPTEPVIEQPNAP